jgi:hypothetical protein
MRNHSIGTVMFNMRYVVVSQESEWKIVKSGRRFPEVYPSKTDAICHAISLAEKDGHAGHRSEVLVGHEDGHFVTEWVYGRDPPADEAARPPLLPRNRSMQ